MSTRTSPRPIVQTTARTSQASLWGNRDLIWSLTQRDLQSRFKATALGWAWSLIVPICQILVYTVVFSVIFRAQPPPLGNGNTGLYAVFLFCGFVPWGLFSGSVTRGTGSVLAARPLLQKVYFPSYVATVGVVTGILVQTLIEFGLLMAVLLALMNVGVSWLMVIPLLLCLYVFSVSLAYILSVANVFSRDVSASLPVVMQLLFFLSGVIFPISLVPTDFHGVNLQALILLNPMAQFIVAFRESLYNLQVPQVGTLLYILAWTVGMAIFARLVFRRWGQDVSEIS